MKRHQRHLERALQLIKTHQKSFGTALDDIQADTILRVRSSDFDQAGNSIYIFEHPQGTMFKTMSEDFVYFPIAGNNVLVTSVKGNKLFFIDLVTNQHFKVNYVRKLTEWEEFGVKPLWPKTGNKSHNKPDVAPSPSDEPVSRIKKEQSHLQMDAIKSEMMKKAIVRARGIYLRDLNALQVRWINRELHADEYFFQLEQIYKSLSAKSGKAKRKRNT